MMKTQSDACSGAFYRENVGFQFLYWVISVVMIGEGGCPGKDIKVPAVEKGLKLPKTGLNCPVLRLNLRTVDNLTHKYAS